MEFFEMDFSELFLNKHGEKIFYDIIRQIKAENPEKYNKKHISLVFKIAFLDFFGFNASQIKKLIDNMYECNEINVNQLIFVHNNSINSIKKYLQSIVE